MGKAFKLLFFYIIYIAIMLLTAKMAPSGPCTPGPGFFLFILLIPISILLLLKDFFSYLKNPVRSKLIPVLTTILVWLAVYLLLYFKVI